jgi:hypothetical protein
MHKRMIAKRSIFLLFIYFLGLRVNLIWYVHHGAKLGFPIRSPRPHSSVFSHGRRPSCQPAATAVTPGMCAPAAATSRVSSSRSLWGDHPDCCLPSKVCGATQRVIVGDMEQPPRVVPRWVERRWKAYFDFEFPSEMLKFIKDYIS